MVFHRIALITAVTASLAVIAAPAASAQKDLASCKPMFDAMAKLGATPYHMSGTLTTPSGGAKAQPMEFISAGGQDYLMYDGHWMRSPMTAAEKTAQEQENIRDAKVLACKRLPDEPAGGVAADVYSLHSENDDSKEDGKVWIAKGSGLILRMDADIDIQDPDHTHMSTHYDYANVHAPAGVQ